MKKAGFVEIEVWIGAKKCPRISADFGKRWMGWVRAANVLEL